MSEIIPREDGDMAISLEHGGVMRLRIHIVPFSSFPKLLIITSLLNLFTVTNVLACETARIVSGDTCENVKVEFNFDQCANIKGVKAATRVLCDGKGFTARYVDPTTRYEAQFKKSDDGWGQGAAWTQDGPIRKIQRASAPKPTGSEGAVVAVAAANVKAEHPAAISSEAASHSAPPAATEIARQPADSATPMAIVLPMTAYLDVLYMWHPRGGSHAVPGRVFDVVSNTLSVQWAELAFDKKVQDVKMHFEVAFGEAVQRFTGLASLAGRGDYTAPSTTNLRDFYDPMNNVTAAYLVYNPEFAPRLTVTAGKIYTHVGYELTKSKDNWNYSRSMSFNFGGPFFHTGVGIGYALIPDQLSSTLYILNGWDGRTSAEANNSATYGLNLGYTGVPGLVMNYNLISGTETTDPDAIRQVHELNAAYTLNESMTLAIDILHGTQKRSKVVPTAEDANWLGLVGYFKWKFSEKNYAALRYEDFDDTHGVVFNSSGGAFMGRNPAMKQKVQGFTTTLSHQLGVATEVRFEYYAQTTSAESLGLFKNESGRNTASQHTASVALLSTF